MSELVEWLRPLIEARKATAEAAMYGAQETGLWIRGHPRGPRDLRDMNGEIVVYNEGSPSDEQFEHIALNDPHDVIARCDFELALLDEHPVRVGYSESLCETCSERDYGGDPYPCRTVRLLGSAYRHFDGYKEEWS